MNFTNFNVYITVTMTRLVSPLMTLQYVDLYFGFADDVMCTYSGSVAVVIDERPVTPCGGQVCPLRLPCW